MPRVGLSRTVNNFSAGVISDSSDVNYPDNSLAEGKNIVVNKDGSVSTRAGFSSYYGASSASSVSENTVDFISNGSGARMFYWPYANSLVTMSMYGSTLNVLVWDLTTDGQTLTPITNASQDLRKVSISFMSDMMIITTPFTSNTTSLVQGYLKILRYDRSDNSVTVVNGSTYNNLMYRDFKGVKSLDIAGNVVPPRKRVKYGLNDEYYADAATYAANIEKSYLYNLMNAGWSQYNTTVVTNDAGTTSDTTKNPLHQTMTLASYMWPALSDHQSYGTSTYTETPELVGKYSPWALLNDNTHATGEVFSGAMLLELGQEKTDREAVCNNVAVNFPSIVQYINDTNWAGADDPSDDKPRVLASCAYAGRMFYSISSREFNVMYSQTRSSKSFNYSVANPTAEYSWWDRCYQEANPTDVDVNAIVETDGGTIDVSEAGLVTSMKVLGNSLIMFSDNGIFQLSGKDTNSFSPTSYSVKKLSDAIVFDPTLSCTTLTGLVVVSTSGLLELRNDQYGVITVADLTVGRVEKKFKEIVSVLLDNITTGGMSFDSFNNRLMLSYPLTSSSTSVIDGMGVLVLDYSLGCYYDWEISTDVDSFNGDSETNRDTNMFFPLSVASDTRGDLYLLCVKGRGNGTAVDTTNLSDTKLHIFKAASGMYDMKNKDATLASTNSSDYAFDSYVTTPKDVFGDFTVKKSAENTTIITENNGCKILLDSKWDWEDTGVSEELVERSLGNNSRTKSVNTYTPRVAGSGRALSLTIKAAPPASYDIDSEGMTLVGYHVSATSASRP